MIDPPDLDATALVRALGSGWRVEVADVRFLPIGLDSAAAAYDVVTPDGGHYFLKVRRGVPGRAAVEVPRYLYAAGLTRVVAPLPTVDGGPWQPVTEDYAALLYPFIDGASAWRSGLTDQLWVEFGEFLAALHHVDVPPSLRAVLAAETFSSGGAGSTTPPP